MFFRKKNYEDVIYEWLNEKQKSIKESTYIKYLYIVETHIIPFLGKYDFRKIKQKNVLAFFNQEQLETLSDSMKNTILIIINSTISYGISIGYRRSFDYLDMKFKKKKNDITYFTIKEQETIEKYLQDNMNIKNLAILVALYTGVRIGELCALKGTDIDFVNNTVSINKTVQRVKDTDGTNRTKLIVGIPKTQNSLRVIPVQPFIIKLLKSYVSNQENYIFTGNDKPKDPRTLEKYFENLLKKLDIKLINFHALRHTFATRLREQKVDIKVISKLLGHSDWKITQEIYVHATFDNIKKSVNEFKGLCSRKNFK